MYVQGIQDITHLTLTFNSRSCFSLSLSRSGVRRLYSVGEVVEVPSSLPALEGLDAEAI